MKKIKKYGIKIALLILIMQVAACSKKDYLTDGGVSSAKTELTAYDYLAQHKYHLFDSLIMMIDHYGLKDEVNSAGTFFAPTDYSIRKYLNLLKDSVRAIDENNDYTFDDMLSNLTAAHIRKYLLTDKITLEGATTYVKEYITKANSTIKIKKVLQTSSVYYTWSDEPVYFLYFYNYPDAHLSNNESCQTTGILTQSGNGTIVHVLNNNHLFVRFTD